jgi:CHAT domain-containing protein
LDLLVAVLARNGKPAFAWQRLEEGLGRSTWDEMSARLKRSPEDQAKLNQLQAGLQLLDKLLEQGLVGKTPPPGEELRWKDLLGQRLKLQNELDQFYRVLEKKYGVSEGIAYPLAQLQEALSSDTALVAWVDIESHPKAKDPNGEHWVVLLRSKGVPIWARLPGSGPGNAWTEADYRLPLGRAGAAPPGPSRPDWRALARRLADQRIGPIRKHLAASDGLPAVRHLVVLPSGVMDGVPVELLVEGVTVSYASSATLYTHSRGLPKPKTQGLLALGDPVFERPAPKERLLSGSRGDWKPLPGTRAEVEALRRLFENHKQPVQTLTDSEASEQKLLELAQGGQLGRLRFLHLATHGEFNHHLPWQSAVILSGDAPPDPGKQLLEGKPIFDGRLSAAKVLQHWKLDADLVTLSACQSGLGKYKRGEGFMGFAQCILLSGSRSVVLSLWKVDDAATALLMERFYQNLLGARPGLKEPLGKAAALAEAKSWLRTLPREEARKAAAALTKGVARGKGRPAQPLLPEVPPAEKDGPPYAHPYYWAAFILVGAPD